MVKEGGETHIHGDVDVSHAFAANDIAEAVDGQESVVGVSGVVDEGEALANTLFYTAHDTVKDSSGSGGDGANVVFVEIEWGGGQGVELPFLVVVCPCKGVLWLRRHAK